MRNILPFTLILGMAACAWIPDLGTPPQPRADLTAGSPGEHMNFPNVNWWEVYGDPQLNDLITEGLKKSPSLAEAAARVRKANAQSQEAGAAIEPTLDANGVLQKYRQSYNEGVPSSFVPHGFQNNASASLNFNYEIDFWGKNHDALEAALSEARAAELDAQQARIMLSTNIASSYATLYQDYAELDAVDESVDIEKKLTSLVTDRYKEGLENQGAVAQEEAKEQALEAQQAMMNESIALAKNKLAALMGATPDRADSITRPQVANFGTIGIPPVIPADLIARRPDLLAASERMQAAAREINVAKAGYYPNINLAANIGHQSLGLGPFFKNSSLTGAFGPAIDLPIFEGGELEGNYRGARADYDMSVAQFEGAIVEALHQVADAETSIQSLVTLTEKTKLAAKAAEFSYNITLDRYKGGIGTYISALNAQNTVILSKFALAYVNARAFTLDIQMVKALGGGYGIVPDQFSAAGTPATQTSEPNKETTP